ncbi:MAG TPA: EamA family transporter [Acidimicrobiia bacterium]|nr:EamA family transporter [Acidimicrobiia bacterium]
MVAATFLALGSAALHAAWNLLVKTSADRLLAAWGQFLVGGLLFLPLLPLVGVPGASTLPFLACSSLVHVLYVVALTRAYKHGDFSFAYPLARGAGALLAAIGGVLFLADSLPPLAWLAIAIVVGGLASLVRPQVGRIALLWAGLTAATIGVYTTLDAAGARRSSGFGYGIAITLGAGLALTVAMLASRSTARIGPALRREWRRYLVGGVCSTLAYSMVLAGARLAPVGYVAALRESSVVLGAGAGWLFLHKRLGRARLASATVVTTGLVLLIVWR